MYFVYILECDDATLYAGITTDIERRLQEHKDGIGSKYTRVHGARKMVYVEEARNRSDALKREYEIKQLSRQKKLLLAQKNNHRG